jgi:hypothetical protein
MTIPSGMSMGASGHKTGCSERNQRGVSKSSYIPVHVVFLFPKNTDCLYAHICHHGLDQDRNMYHYH